MGTLPQIEYTHTQPPSQLHHAPPALPQIEYTHTLPPFQQPQPFNIPMHLEYNIPMQLTNPNPIPIEYNQPPHLEYNQPPPTCPYLPLLAAPTCRSYLPLLAPTCPCLPRLAPTCHTLLKSCRRTNLVISVNWRGECSRAGVEYLSGLNSCSVVVIKSFCPACNCLRPTFRGSSTKSCIHGNDWVVGGACNCSLKNAHPVL